MTVKLISYSRPTEEMRQSGIDDCQELIAYCARVSNPNNQLNTDTSERLIRYLIDHRHWSPLEMVSVCVEIVTTRDIARQILRHRSFSFQEFSQRYADPTQDLSFVPKQARLQDHANRQNSVELDVANNVEHRELAKTWLARQQDLARAARETYTWAVSNGIAKEQARAVLPEGMTESRLYMQGTLRSWVHYIELRTDPGTQKEHRAVAQQCATAIAEVFPMITEFVAKDSHEH